MAKTKFEKFVPRKVKRSQLKNAPYNPRIIDAKAKEKLRKGIESKGMVEPIVWNKKSGNIVGGHQRIEQLDALEGSMDYELTVAEINVDEKTEKELNILLNNPSAQGDWDIEALQSLFDSGIDVEETGFDLGEVYQLFGNNPAAAPSGVLEELNKQLEEAKERIEELDKKNEVRDGEDFYLVVVFPSHKQREQFTDFCGLEDNRYVDGKWLQNYIFDEDAETETETEDGKKEDADTDAGKPAKRGAKS